MSRAPWRGSWRARRSARSFPPAERRGPAERSWDGDDGTTGSISRTSSRRMHGAVSVLKTELSGLRTGRASVKPPRSGHGQRLRHADADQPGGDGQRAGAAHAFGAGLGQGARRRGRPRHPRRQSRAEPDHGGHAAAHPDPGAERRAAPGNGQGRRTNMPSRRASPSATCARTAWTR